MDAPRTDFDDPNGVVLLNEDGLATFGRLPSEALGALSPETEAQIVSAYSYSTESVEAMREAVSEVLEDAGFPGVRWPLSAETMEKIQEGNPPQGLLLTRVFSPPGTRENGENSVLSVPEGVQQ